MFFHNLVQRALPKYKKEAKFCVIPEGYILRYIIDYPDTYTSDIIPYISIGICSLRCVPKLETTSCGLSALLTVSKPQQGISQNHLLVTSADLFSMEN